jgi:hypothetical protein
MGNIEISLMEWNLKMWTGLIWIRIRSNCGFVNVAMELWVPK